MSDPPSPRARRVASTALVAGPALVAVWAILTCAASRGVHEARYGHDVFLPLDGAWRVLNGQTQHVDFYSPYGPVETELVAWMMRLGGAGVLAIPRAVALVGLIAAAGMLAVVARRTSRAVGAWLVAVAALTAVGRNQLGFAFLQVSHSAYYNRIGFALLAIVMLESLVASRDERPGLVVAGGALSGFFTAILLFVKLTFPLVAAVFLAASALMVLPSRARGIALAAGAVAGLLAGGSLIGFHYGAMLGDYAFVAGARCVFEVSRLGFWTDMAARDSVIITPGRIVETIANEARPTLLVLVIAAIMPLDALRRPERRQMMALVAITWGASLALVLTSWQWGESPLFAVLALALLEYVVRSEAVDWRRPACIALCAACVLELGAKQVSSVLYDEQWQATYDARADTFPGTAATGLVIDGSDSQCRPREYGPRLLQGVEAIRAVSEPRVITLDFSNPFPFLMQTRPPSGGGLCWHHDSTFSDEIFLSPRKMFGDANVVVVSKCPEDAAAVTSLAKLYDPALGDFHLVKDTGALLVLSNAPGAASAP